MDRTYKVSSAAPRMLATVFCVALIMLVAQVLLGNVELPFVPVETMDAITAPVMSYAEQTKIALGGVGGFITTVAAVLILLTYVVTAVVGVADTASEFAGHAGMIIFSAFCTSIGIMAMLSIPDFITLFLVFEYVTLTWHKYKVLLVAGYEDRGVVKFAKRWLDGPEDKVIARHGKIDAWIIHVIGAACELSMISLFAYTMWYVLMTYTSLGF